MRPPAAPRLPDHYGRLRQRIARVRAALAMLLLCSFGAAAATSGAAADSATLAQGEYLARLGNCETCHTAEGGSPWAGGRPFRTPFGVLYSSNITSDIASGIGSWSSADFRTAMRHGIRPDGTHLYPAFPFTSFARMNDEDIDALYRYIQALEPVESTPRDGQLQFPFNIRELMVPWKFLFHDAEAQVQQASRSAQWNRGAYLVEAVAHCGACHTPRNLLGAERSSMAFAGAVYSDRVPTGHDRAWSAVNLTPAQSGLRAWTVEDIAAYLQTGQNRHAVVNGPMVEVVMHATRHLSDADAHAIGVYLKELPAIELPSGAAASDEVLAAGKVGYTVHCGSCHQASGQGDLTLGVPLAGSTIVQAADPASLINLILYGPQLPPPPFVVDRSRMKMFGKRLSDDDIAAIATYVRASFGNAAGAVTPEQVRVQR